MQITTHDQTTTRRLLALSAAAAMLLAGCGGGGGGGPATTADASTANTATGVTGANDGAAAPDVPAATPSTPAPAPAPAPVGVSLASQGGVCDGRTDNSAALSRGIAAARAAGQPLVIPAGQCNFSDVIRLDGATIVGHGTDSVLYSTNWQRSAIFMSGAGPAVANVKLTGVAAPSRQAPWEMTRITVMGARDFVIDGVTIEGSGAAGIQTAQAPVRGRIANNVVRNTLSDSIHVTGGASSITIENNLVENSGDDGIAVVSYMSESGRVNNVTARNNVVRNNRFGRNMSVVGGGTIVYENNLLQGNLAGYACFLVAQESVGTLATKGSDDVRFVRNTLENCGSRQTGHGAVLVYSDGAQPNNDILLLGNDIRQAGQTGIRAYGNATTGLRLENNRISGASPDLDITTPGVAVIPYAGGQVGYVAP